MTRRDDLGKLRGTPSLVEYTNHLILHTVLGSPHVVVIHEVGQYFHWRAAPGDRSVVPKRERLLHCPAVQKLAWGRWGGLCLKVNSRITRNLPLFLEFSFIYFCRHSVW